MKKILVGLLMILMGTVGPLSADAGIITFDEVLSPAVTQGQWIQGEFSAFGATFNNAFWDGLNLNGQGSAPGFSGGSLVNLDWSGTGPNYPTDFLNTPLTIIFNTPVNNVQFAATNYDGTFDIFFYMGVTPIDTTTFAGIIIPFPADPSGFISYNNVQLYDTIKIYSKSGEGLAIDYLSFSVPEPGTMLMLCSGLIGLAGFGRKKVLR